MTEAPHPAQSLTTDYLSDLKEREKMDGVYKNASVILDMHGKTIIFDYGNRDDISLFLKATDPTVITPGIGLRLREGDKKVDEARYVDGIRVSLHQTIRKDPDVIFLEALIENSSTWTTFAKLERASVQDWTGQRATPERLAQIKLTVEELGLALYKGLQNNHDTPDPDFEDGHHV